MTDAKLGNRSVDRADLQPGTTASIAQIGSVDMILPVRGKERQGCKSFDDVLARTRPGESLKQFLQDKTGDHNGVAAFQRVAQFAYLESR